ncbi:MAG TPA: hypothetical protein VHN80_13720 [Kineosporiaceae bacterium]|nr:hypothetical protein [Kineosporiaceae bacterium]
MPLASVRDHDPALAASLPLARAFVFASVAVPVSVVGHVAGGGSAPDDATFPMAAALVVVAYRGLLAGRERSWPALALALAAAEPALHFLFVAGSRCTATVASGDPSPMPGMIMPGMEMPGPGGSHAAVSAGLIMLAGHTASALILGWFLRSGERALWSAAGGATANVRSMIRPLLTLLTLIVLIPVEPAHPTHRPIPAPDADLRRFRATGGRFWRGPPARASAV